MCWKLTLLYWQSLYSLGFGLPSGHIQSDSWTLTRAECQRIDAFELWCWRRFLEVPWIERRSNQSILREINPEYSLEGLMLKLKLQYFGHLMWTVNSLENPWCWGSLRTEGEENIRGWDGGMAVQWTWTWAHFWRWWETRRPGVLLSMGSQRVGHDWTTEQKQLFKVLNLNYLF